MSTSSTPTPTRGVPFTLGGAEYRLRYSFATRRKIVEAMGDGVFTDGVKADQIPEFIWLGMGGEASGLTLAQVEELVDFQNLEEITTAMKTALGVKATAADPSAPAPEAAPGSPTA